MPDTQPPPFNPFKKTTAAAKRAAMLSVIAIVLAAIAGLSAWIVWQRADETSKEINTYSVKLQQKGDDATRSLQNTVTTVQTQLRTVQDKFNEVQNKLNELTHLSKQAQDQRTLNEVGYLIHMANLQLIINRNVDGALQLMRLAEKQLKKITSPNVISLKHAITQSIVALKKAPRLDVSKLLAQIEQLKLKVQNLPSMPTQKTVVATKAPDTSTSPSLPWYKKLGHSLSSLKELVIIRHEKKPIKPMLSPQQLLFLKENVQLKLSEAEWAVLHQNSAIYQKSLASAKQMLMQYYPNQEAMTGALNDIDALSKININPKLPGLLDTLKTFSATSTHASTSSGAHQ